MTPSAALACLDRAAVRLAARARRLEERITQGDEGVDANLRAGSEPESGVAR